jgi:hypothetical protein
MRKASIPDRANQFLLLFFFLHQSLLTLLFTRFLHRYIKEFSDIWSNILPVENQFVFAKPLIHDRDRVYQLAENDCNHSIPDE